jgi:DHA3 family macrolide efflux protein-like MFS transporter
MSSKNWLRRFATIWTGQQLSLIGSSLGGFALVWWLTIETGSAQVLANAMIALLVPRIILWPFVGALVDRWSRKRIIVIADTWTALVSLGLALLFWFDAMQLWHVYAVIFARAIGGAFHQPAFNAVTPLLVPEKHLSRVAGLGSAMQGTLSVAGPLLGALMISILPLHGIMLIDVGTAGFAIVPMLLATIPTPKRASTGPQQSIWSSIREGLVFARSVRGFTTVIVAFALLNFIANPAYRFLPLLVTEFFKGGAVNYASLSSAWGFGVIAAGLVMGAWGGFRCRMWTVVFGTALQGAGTLLIGLSPAWAFFLAVIGMGIAGYGNSTTNAPFAAMMQAGVPNELQGRVYTFSGVLILLAQPLGFAFAGPLAGAVGLRTWLVAVGIVQAAVVLGLMLLPSVRGLETTFSRIKADRAEGSHQQADQ